LSAARLSFYPIKGAKISTQKTLRSKDIEGFDISLIADVSKRREHWQNMGQIMSEAGWESFFLEKREPIPSRPIIISLQHNNYSYPIK